MKISKYLHSCLLFEQDGFQLLVDPGKFSFTEGLIKPEQFAGVDAIIITHNHPDHLDIEVLKQIMTSSQARLYINAEVAKQTDAAWLPGQLLVPGINQIGPFKLDAFDVMHEALLDSPAPQMTAFVIDGKVLHPVDSFEENLQRFKGIELLLLPVMAPFTTELTVAAFADRVQPKQILPVHDGYAKPFFVKQRYETYAKHFEKQGIVFHAGLDIGNTIEI